MSWQVSTWWARVCVRTRPRTSVHLLGLPEARTRMFGVLRFLVIVSDRVKAGDRRIEKEIEGKARKVDTNATE